MKRFTVLLLKLFCAGIALAQPGINHAPQIEKLDRGIIAFHPEEGKLFISWRLLATDDSTTTFQLLKDGDVIRDNITQATSIELPSTDGTLQLATLHGGERVELSDTIKPWPKKYLQLHLMRPLPVEGATYTPNDCSVGDVDGDGRYEIFVKWDPINAHDNSHAGTTANVYIDCYRLDGTFLWRIDLGRNIRAGAHYTQFMVYDFNHDGKAEMICKTAPGSKDGSSHYVSEAATDSRIRAIDNGINYSDELGRILAGEELLTAFDGLTGKAIHTIWYCPNRAGTFNQCGEQQPKSFWGDTYGNRQERYLACVAHLDGMDKNASAVFGRGYYTRAYLWAVDFDGKQLKHKWLHASISRDSVELYDANWNKTTRTYRKNTSGSDTSFTAFANGNHNLSVGDVDGDGCDEILYGSCAFDNDGSLLYSTGLGHGDAIHFGDLDPDREGLEVFTVHEEPPYGYDLHDAATGEILVRGLDNDDTGRGLAADIDADYRGAEFTTSGTRYTFNIKGKPIYNHRSRVNFRIYWDGDIQDELFDNVSILKWDKGHVTELGVSGEPLRLLGSPASCNGTKHTPCLQADLFGDWREELILRSTTDNATLNIYSTSIPTSLRMPTLMHDHIYRMGIAWQNVAYNQPPHLGIRLYK